MNTIDTILKLSGHKDMKSFYKEFPDEDSFMAKHGKEFKKAMRGAKIKKAQQGYTGKMSVPDLLAFGAAEQEAPLKMESWMTDSTNFPTPAKTDWMGMIAPGMKIGESVIKGFQQLKDEKRALQKAKQWSKVSDVNLQASQLTPEPIERKYTRPEDIINTGDKFFPVYGVGTDALAKKGKKIKKANFGTQVGDVLQGIGSDRLTNLSVGLSGGESAGATFGGAAGDIISMIPGVGPIVGTLAKPVLSAVGNLIDTNPEKTKRYQDRFEGNINQMAMGKGMQGLFNTNNAYMASGGNISNMESEGELRIGKGGAISLSYNPFLPDGGETIEFRGPSHAEGGMPVAYGNSPVEVEGGEPAVKLQSGGTDEDLVVFGDLTIPGRNKKFKSVVKDIAKKEARENKKTEKALLSIEDLSPTTPFDKLKLNSAKATLMGTTQKLKTYANEKQQLASLQEAINQTAEEMNIDANALSKGNIKMAKKGASVSKAQNGKRYILDPSNEEAVYQRPSINAASNYLSSGMVPIPKPTPVYKHEYGPESEGGPRTVLPEVVIKPSTKASMKVSELDKAVAEAVDLGRELRIPDDVAPPRMKTAYERYKYNDDETEITSLGRGVQQSNDKVLDVLADLYDKGKKRDRKLGKKETLDLLMSGLDSLLPYFRPSDTERLDPRQLMGEMFALTDKEEPVQAQTFQPQLGSPYSVSFADQKNDVIAQVRSAQRMAGNNPAAQAMIASQATQALNKINAEEFRMNQGMADKVYGENRATMNQAQLQNLQILDNQYTRQSQAKSNTKARLQAALNSISDKYLKNELNNKILATYENLYNYRFDDRGRKQNWNAPYQWNMEGSDEGYTVSDPNSEWVMQWENDPATGERIQVRRRRKTKKEQEATSIPAKNGMNIARAIKSL